MAKKDYSNWSKEELVKEVEKKDKLLKRKYGLVWEDKPEEVVEMCKEKLPVLKEVKNKEIITDKNKPVNLLIEGDNYHVLSVLNYTHAGKVDVIYIDPPYNTGSSKWIYNNKYIDSEDAFRHSKWLSFMSKRLQLARNLLKDSGVIIVTIDDYEIHSLGLLMDEIFGENNRMSILVIESNPRGRTSNAFFATSHEYYLFYGRNASKCKIEEQPLNEEQSAAFKYKDEISYYRLLPLRKSGAASRRNDRPKQFYPIYVNKNNLKLSLVKLSKAWIKVLPIDESGEERVWKLGKENCGKYIKSGDIIAKKGGSGFRFFQKDRIKLGRKPKTVWIDPKYDASAHGTNLIAEILGKRNAFDYPKSLYAVIDSLRTIIRKNKNALALDFFAGSGTTGHAILELNKEDGGNRKFILCTNNENNNGNSYKIAEDICYPRVKKVIEGYKNLRGEKVKGLGGNLKYLKTDFIDAESTDRNKRKLVDKSTEMLCLKEDCFDELVRGYDFKTFVNNQGKHLGIIYSDDGIEPFKKKVKKLKKKFVVYVFSLDESAREEEFEDVAKWVELKPIPAVILNVYKKIFK
jgi:adenine-specific DNA-methyltransferase